MRVLGIDPGSRLTGYGCVDVVSGRIRSVEHGTLKLASTSGKQDVALEERLLILFSGLGEVLDRLKPEAFVVERVFFAKNAVSSLKLGQARGVVLVAGALRGLPVFEYSASEVKRAVTGSGSADKEQVAQVLQLLLGGQSFKTSDASDALALAVCHAQQSQGGRPELSEFLKARGSRRRRMSLADSLGLVPEKVGTARSVDFSKKE